MITFSILTLGCKVNQYESSQIRQFLEDFGLCAVRPDDKPDMIVINTCCVTSTASAKSRQYIQRAKKMNPEAVRVICGCLAAQQTGELRDEEDNTTHLLVSHNDIAVKLHQIVGGPLSGSSSFKTSQNPNIVTSSLIKPDNHQKVNGFTGLTSLPTLPLLTSFKEQTRAFLKVQDGCDGVCSYCIIPKVRPMVRSKPIEEAVAEAKALVSAGHKEVVVTGVNLGAYGRKTTKKTKDEGRGTPRQSFAASSQSFDYAKHQTAAGSSLRYEIADLLEELARLPGLLRLRVSSLEPGDISEELLDVFCGHKNIMPHIHLSVQSGSGRVLKRMCRPYSAQELREKIELIKRRLDRPAITCDMIVGFPGETEEDFAETVELAKWAGFSKIHTFPFSSRMGTPASKMKNKVDSKTIKKRAEILRRLGDELGFKFREQFVGETCEVLLENTEPLSGHCERYFVIEVKSGIADYTDNTDLVATKMHKKTQDNCRLPIAECRFNKNEIIKVRLTANRDDGAEGEEIKN